MTAKRAAAIALACVLAAVMLFSALFIALETGHDCHGEGCAVCVMLGVCENLLRSVLTASVLTAAASGAACGAARMSACVPAGESAGTPVALKVKLSD